MGFEEPAKWRGASEQGNQDINYDHGRWTGRTVVNGGTRRNFLSSTSTYYVFQKVIPANFCPAHNSNLSLSSTFLDEAKQTGVCEIKSIFITRNACEFT